MMGDLKAKWGERALALQEKMAEKKKAQAQAQAKEKPARPRPQVPKTRPSTSAAPQAAQPVLRTPEEAERSAFLVMVNSVLRCLRNADRALNTDDLKNMAGVDLTSDAKLRKEIQTNPRVNYDQVGDVYLYKPKYDILNKQQLLGVIQKEWKRSQTSQEDPRRYGIPVKELSDAYKGVEQDLEALASERHIYLIWSRAFACPVAFPRDLQYPTQPVECILDPDMDRLMSESLRVGPDFHLEDELKKAGIAPSKRIGGRPVQQTKAKRRKRQSTRQSKLILPEE